MNNKEKRLIQKNIRISPTEKWDGVERFLEGFPLDLEEISCGNIRFVGLSQESRLELQTCTQFDDSQDTYYNPCLALYTSFEVVNAKTLSDCLTNLTRYISETKAFDRILSKCSRQFGGRINREAIEPSIGLYVNRYYFSWIFNEASVMKKGVQELYLKFGDKK